MSERCYSCHFYRGGIDNLQGTCLHDRPPLVDVTQQREDNLVEGGISERLVSPFRLRDVAKEDFCSAYDLKIPPPLEVRVVGNMTMVSIPLPMRDADHYQVRYSTDRATFVERAEFTEDVDGTIDETFANPAAGTYYFQIRSIDRGVTSKWSYETVQVYA